jgi:indolepyruvate ferredoxin oxidoreductase
MGEVNAMLAEVGLDDKYTAISGRVLLSGTQALVRLPLEQSRLDARMGINSAGYISGYRGSPVGTYDSELWRARSFLDAHGIVFQPGVNEDLAATAIWGTQQLGLFPGARHDGVFALWYGKGPGVDRSGDAFKHANLAGTSPKGGVLVAFGDDHGAKSSTLAHQSEQAMIAASIPVLNPATIADLLEFGLFGWAMSRYSGLWVGLKCVNELLEASATIELPQLPSGYHEPEGLSVPPGGIHIRMGHEPVETERRLMRNKLPMALAFAAANSIDRIVWNGAKKRLGIVAAGKAWLDVLQALTRLGIDQKRGEALGIGLYKPGLTWPIEPKRMRAFAQGYEEILFVEEKRPLIEDQAARLLYAMEAGLRPAISGKAAPDGTPLLPSDGMLDPGEVARAIAARLDGLGMVDGRLGEAIAANEAPAGGRANAPAGITRRPYFCSGCPHNSSTKVPEGSHAMAGIGCSYMAVWMDRDTVTSVHMGAEGANWNGIAPFTDMPHIFQNIGDGTYFHSGLMAIRAAVASGANITYKILYNDAVAMTGGQPVDGPLTVPQISRQVAAEGVGKIVVVTDEPDKYPPDAGFAGGVTIHHRDDLRLVQQSLRSEKGTTVLIYDQTCAAEKRRRRKRHEYPDPPKRAFINDAVCEGCGDCTVKSNCVSVLPLETELGRKRQIDQSACNKDFSCVTGFCPSFVTVHGGELRAPTPAAAVLWEDLAEPELASLEQPWSMVITGIGGTGVVTIGAILAMAAHMEGKAASVFDMTGLAQKNGAVMSHLRIAADPGRVAAARIGSGEADVLLGCDLVVSGSDDALKTLRAGKTRAIVNSHVVPTGDFQQDTDIDFHADAFLRAVRSATGADATEFFDATSLAMRLAGDSIAANLIMVGYASQRGLLPVSPAAIERAIELNGVAVAANKRNLALGRLAASRPDLLPGSSPEAEQPLRLAELVSRRAAMLADYQDTAYAEDYRRYVNDILALENSKNLGSTPFARAVAESLYKLMAYKDEYEVARLYTSGAFLEKVGETFAGDFRLRFHLAPPIFARRDPATGELRKREFGQWVFGAFRVLARLKRLRGTALDPFGHTKERRQERRMIGEYKEAMLETARGLTPANHRIAVEIARLPMKIKGYGHVKERKYLEAEAERRELMKRFAGAVL